MERRRSLFSLLLALATLTPTVVVPIPIWHHHAHRHAPSAPARLTQAPTTDDVAHHEECPLCVTAVVIHPTTSHPATLSIPLTATRAVPVATIPNDYDAIRICRARGPPDAPIGV